MRVVWQDEKLELTNMKSPKSQISLRNASCSEQPYLNRSMNREFCSINRANQDQSLTRRAVNDWLKEITVSEAFFYFGLVLWIASAMLQSSLWVYQIPNLALIKRVGIISIIISELFTSRHSFKSVLIAVSLFFVAMLAWYVNDIEIVNLLIIVYCAMHHDEKYVIKIALITEAFVLFFIIASSQIGLVRDYEMLQSSRWRHFLGFHYATFSTHYYLNVVLMYAFLRRLRISYIEITIFAVIDYSLYVLTDSRNSFVLVLVFLVIIVLMKLLNMETFHGRIAKVFVTCSFIICFAVSAAAFFGIDMTTSFGQSVDSVLSGRLTLTHRAVNYYGLPIIGGEAEWNTSHWIGGEKVIIGEHLYVDNSFFNIFISDGAIMLGIMLAMLTRLCWYACKRDDAILSVALVLFAIHSLIDPQMIQLEYCGLLLLMGHAFAFPGKENVRIMPERNEKRYLKKNTRYLTNSFENNQ